MKTKLPTIAFSAFALGTFFKMEHWPGANILLLLSALLIISSTSIEFTQLEKDRKIRGLQYGVAIMIIACSIAAIFKIFHWPNSDFLVNIAMNISIPVAIVFFFFSNVEYRLSRNLVAGIFYLLLLLMIFFPGNPIGKRANQAHQENTMEHQNAPTEPAH